MKALSVTLVTDGSSDRALLPIAEFLFDRHCPQAYVVRHAEALPPGPLGRRLADALALFPCDVLLVHRDAEQQAVTSREAEIASAAARVAASIPRVCVVPVRMTEAWLLLDEAAIRRAAGNPNGQAALGLPPVERLEAVDAKQILFAALQAACELGARRMRRFDVNRARAQVAGFIEDMSILRRLASFRHFEDQVRSLFAGESRVTA